MRYKQSMVRALSAVIFVLILLNTVPVISSTAKEGEQMIAWNNSMIKYFGRWQEMGDSMVQNVFGGFCELRFSGSGSVSVQPKTNGTVAVSVDGGAAIKKELGGGQTVIAENLSSGEHTVRIFTYSQHSRPVISGFVLDSEAQLLPAEKRKTIEFIGDSVTEGYTGENADSHILSYAHLTAERLGWDRNIVALGGITVTPGYGYFTDKTGMLNRYFKSEMYGENADLWDVKSFVPDMIVINLGTNDRGISSDKIIDSYALFLQKLREAYTNTPLFVLVPFCHDTQLAIVMEKAVEQTKAENVHLIETASWQIDPGSDNTHPDKEEHVKIAEKLSEILKYYSENGKLPEQQVVNSSSNTSAYEASTPNSSGTISVSSDKSDSTSDESDSMSAEITETYQEPDVSTDENEYAYSKDNAENTDSAIEKHNKFGAVIAASVGGALALGASIGFFLYALKKSRASRKKIESKE